MNELAKISKVHPLVKKNRQQQLAKLQPQLDEGLVKRQYWRTPTEARFSVLNDASFPTNASKYWQAVREQQTWSDIMAELTEAEDFDTTNVDTHQAQSYLQTLENRRKTLSPGSSQPEIMNVLGPLNTLRRLLGLDELSLEETMKEIKDGRGERTSR